MFSEIIVHYPTDEKAIKQLDRDIAEFHNAVTVKYMDDILKLTPQQKVEMLDNLMQDIAALIG